MVSTVFFNQIKPMKNASTEWLSNSVPLFFPEILCNFLSLIPFSHPYLFTFYSHSIFQRWFIYSVEHAHFRFRLVDLLNRFIYRIDLCLLSFKSVFLLDLKCDRHLAVQHKVKIIWKNLSCNRYPSASISSIRNSFVAVVAAMFIVKLTNKL